MLPGSECLSKAAEAPSQGFRKEFQKALGVAFLFLEQIKSWDLLSNPPPYFCQSSLEGSEEQSEADLRRPLHPGARERVCMGTGM